MNRLQSIFCIVFGFVTLFELLIPSTAFAESDNINHIEMVDSYTTYVSVPETAALTSTDLSEGTNKEQVVHDKDIQSLFFYIIAGIAVLATGIIAGTVFTYANSVIPDLRRLDDCTFVFAMRHRTALVANPIF